MHTGTGVFGYLIWLQERVTSYPISRIIKGISDCMEVGKEDGQCLKVGGLLCFFSDQHALLSRQIRNVLSPFNCFFMMHLYIYTS